MDAAGTAAMVVEGETPKLALALALAAAVACWTIGIGAANVCDGQILVTENCSAYSIGHRSSSRVREPSHRDQRCCGELCRQRAIRCVSCGRRGVSLVVTLMSSALDRSVDDAIRASFRASGMLRAMGARIVELRAGVCAIELPFGDGVAQQHGFFHGGAIGTLADTAGGYAAMTTVPRGTDVLTLEYKINFLRPATGRLLVARGEVLRAGRSVIVTRVDVLDKEQRVCAAMQQTIVPAPSAKAST